MPSAILIIGLTAGMFAQTLDAGRKTFETYCGTCHGADGKGGERGPSILSRLPARDDRQLATFIREGRPEKGMPPSLVEPSEMAGLLKFLRTIDRKSVV